MLNLIGEKTKNKALPSNKKDPAIFLEGNLSVKFFSIPQPLQGKHHFPAGECSMELKRSTYLLNI